MYPKALLSATIFAALALLSLAMPAPPTVRQGFPLTLPLEATTNSATEPEVDPMVAKEDPAETTPEETPASVTIETPITVPISEIPAPSMEEELEPEPMVSAEPGSAGEPMSEFAYNVGGSESGMFAADPIEWVVGNTSAFEMAEAEIVGDEEYAEIYRSHRYGLLGSIWGYDIPVSQSGMYDCTLFYAETFSDYFTDNPNRTFLVEIAGDGAEEVHAEEFDVMVEVKGAEFTAYQKSFSNIAVATTLRLRETPSKGDAFLSGIHCMYTAPLMMA